MEPVPLHLTVYLYPQLSPAQTIATELLPLYKTNLVLLSGPVSIRIQAALHSDIQGSLPAFPAPSSHMSHQTLGQPGLPTWGAQLGLSAPELT